MFVGAGWVYLLLCVLNVENIPFGTWFPSLDSNQWKYIVFPIVKTQQNTDREKENMSPSHSPDPSTLKENAYSTAGSREHESQG